MKKSLRYISFIYLLFLLLISVSGMSSGVAKNVIYYLAFLLPFLVALLLKRRTGAPFSAPKLSFSSEGAKIIPALIFPCVTVIFTVSFLCSLVFTSLGLASLQTDVSGNIVLVILVHALLPAICEEALFRYIPIAFIAPHSKKWCIIISSLLFALIHGNVFQIPYAFVAGLIFAAVDIAFDSIIPSLILHFTNNLMSVFWMRADAFSAFMIILILLSAVSVLYLFFIRHKLKDKFSELFADEEKPEFSYEPILLIVLLVVISLTNLFTY